MSFYDSVGVNDDESRSDIGKNFILFVSFGDVSEDFRLV